MTLAQVGATRAPCAEIRRPQPPPPRPSATNLRDGSGSSDRHRPGRAPPPPRQETDAVARLNIKGEGLAGNAGTISLGVRRLSLPPGGPHRQ